MCVALCLIFFLLSYFYLHKWPHGLPINSAGLEEFFSVFLGVFTEFRKATISFVMSVCPSACMEQHCYQWKYEGTSKSCRTLFFKKIFIYVTDMRTEQRYFSI